MNSPSPVTVARVAANRRTQFARFLGYRFLGYNSRCAYLMSIRPL